MVFDNGVVKRVSASQIIEQANLSLRYDPGSRQLSLSQGNSNEKTVYFATVPVGGIIMWSGDTNDIPNGWALCNGENDTPDLRDRFIVGAGKDYETGDTGGESNVILNIEEMPIHNHGGMTNENGEHSHFFRDTQFTENSNYNQRFIAVNGVEHFRYNGLENRNSSTDTYGRDVFSYYRSRFTISAGNHYHTINSEGGGRPHENRPPYYALAFIMFVGNE